MEIPLQRRIKLRAKLFESIAEIISLVKEYVSGEMQEEEFQTQLDRVVRELTDAVDQAI